MYSYFATPMPTRNKEKISLRCCVRYCWTLLLLQHSSHTMPE